jgi:hypothetical protein
MHIEFDLPNNNTVLAIAIHKLEHELKAWSEKYSVTIIHYDYIKGWPKYQLLLPSKSAYTHFTLTWQPKESYFMQYGLVD